MRTGQHPRVRHRVNVDASAKTDPSKPSQMSPTGAAVPTLFETLMND